jgi:hypothetical protein
MGDEAVGAGPDHVLDADRLAVLDQDPGGAGLGHAGQVRPAQGRRQIGRRRAPALAVADGQVVGAKALLLVAVEVLGRGVARLAAGLDQGGVERALGLPARHVQRARAAVIGVAAAMVGFRALEVGQDLGIGPARQPHLPPLVVVARVAADIDHAVDRRAAAQALAARPPQLAIVEVRFFLGPEAPVLLALGLDQLAHPGRHLDQERGVLAAGLQQQDLDVGVLGQSGREDAAGRTGADDDVVVARAGHGPTSPPWNVIVVKTESDAALGGRQEGA